MVTADTYERYMLQLVNEERVALGLDPLQLEQSLNAAAELHSQWMLETNIFSHTGVDNSSATERMDAAGFIREGAWRTAENIAIQSERGAEGIMDDVADLHQRLMDSPGHRANILTADLEYIGIGIEIGEFDYETQTYSSVIVTQNFGATDADVTLDPDPEPAAPPAPNRIYGDEDANTLQGSAGEDIIRGEGGNDALEGMDGQDLLRGGAGADRILSGEGNDTAYGGSGNDYIRGDNGNDRIFAGSGDDIVRGGRNDDTLLGATGDDIIYGGSGDDRLNGQGGNDRLIGSSGTDEFVFRAGYGTDRILDFENNIDKIDLTSWGFTDKSDVMALAKQSGSVTVIKFDTGDILRLRDTQLNEIENDFLI